MKKIAETSNRGMGEKKIPPPPTKKFNRGMEENTMEILDASGVKEAGDIDDDRLAFLEAVRVSSLVPESGTAPTSKMFEAVFQILKNETSLELSMTSYQLLSDLDKRFPRVYLSHSDQSDATCSTSSELFVNREAWSPFAVGTESAYSERDGMGRQLGDRIDSSGFFSLMENIAQAIDETNVQLSGTKLLGDMMLFQYLVRVLERDLLPRNTLFNENMNWILLRESLLNMLLGSRRINYKSLIKHCLSIVSKGSCTGFSLHNLENVEKSSGETVYSNEIALFELDKGTSVAVQKLLTLIMDLDMAKKQADMQGSTSRVDVARIPLVEIIVDELTYNEDLLPPFLQVLSEPKRKMEIILQYFGKYSMKPSVRTRRSNSSEEDGTLEGVLRCFSSDTSTKSIIRKIGIEVAQLLLAHAFQAYLSLQNCVKDNTDSSKDTSRDAGSSCLLQICKDTITAYHNIRKTVKHMEMMPLGKEAVFTAATILSTK